jgi:hypothetical protein
MKLKIGGSGKKSKSVSISISGVKERKRDGECYVGGGEFI